MKGSGFRGYDEFKGFKKVCFLLTSDRDKSLSINLDSPSAYMGRGTFGSIRIRREATLEELQLPDFTVVPRVYTGNDGKIYNAVKIDNKLWLTENLAEIQ